MNGVFWGTVYLLILCLLAFFGSLHSSNDKRGYYFKDNYTAYFLAALCLLPGLGYFYMSSIKIDFNDWGNQADYGQLGDFFGGLLNPLIGFVSIFLLIQNLTILHKENSREQKKEDRADIKKMIEDFTLLLVQQQREKNLSIHIKKNFSLLDLKRNTGAEAHETKNIKLFIKEAICVIRDRRENEVHDEAIVKTSGTLESLAEMRSKILSICELYVTLIDKDQIHTINKFTFLKMEEFLSNQYDLQLISDKEYHQYLDTGSKKEGISTEGFYRRIPVKVEVTGVAMSAKISQPTITVSPSSTTP